LVDDQVRALAEPRRRQILELVRDEELAAGEIAAHFAVTRPAISQHLTVLKAAGLLVERRDGARRLYRADPAGLLGLKQFVDRFWATGLARLKAEAESEAAHRGSRPRKGRR
jgi:DNA-binding transcriptional ArsR family regulator